MGVEDFWQPDGQLKFCTETLEARERTRPLADIGFQILGQRGATRDELRIGHRLFEAVFEPLARGNWIVRRGRSSV